MLSACGQAPPDATPSGALNAFVDAMARSGYDPLARKDAYLMLEPSARESLSTRARQATALAAGQTFQPWDMIVREQFRTRFPVSIRRMREEIHGNTATVTVFGESSDMKVSVPMVKEGAAWRVVLNIP